MDTYLTTNSLWVEDSISWEETIDIAYLEWTIFNFFFYSSFSVLWVFVEYFNNFSFLDLVFLEMFWYSNIKQFFFCFYNDLLLTLNIKYFFFHAFFYTTSGDFYLLIVSYFPELLFAVYDFFFCFWNPALLFKTTVAYYDVFNDNSWFTLTEFLEYFFYFFLYFWFLTLVSNFFQVFSLNSFLDPLTIRFYFYFYTLSKELRLYFELMIILLFFLFFYWTMMVATFDDDQEELIEFFSIFFFSFFCTLISFLLYRYSVHYFAFLELSVSEGRSVMFITKQFVRDISNTFALFLRFFILLFRLNVYDGLDDFYDSYYFFVGDFDEDEYFDEIFFNFINVLFYDFDNNDDRLYTLEEENEFFFDVFYLYYLNWSKFFFFLFFIIEEVLRLSLAFYISYLIVFDVHAVNNSYVEDYFFIKKRNS